jgi:hypothetical protein
MSIVADDLCGLKFLEYSMDCKLSKEGMVMYAGQWLESLPKYLFP